MSRFLCILALTVLWAPLLTQSYVRTIDDDCPCAENDAACRIQRCSGIGSGGGTGGKGTTSIKQPNERISPGSAPAGYPRPTPPPKEIK
jgi:hypothetical protein